MSKFVFKILAVAAMVFTVQSYSLPERSGKVMVAVASNVLQPMQHLIKKFEKETGYSVKISAASTGKHYAQILNGAPFDIFMAADSLRPQKLEEAGYTVADSRFTYAFGNLVLWSPESSETDCIRQLNENRFSYIAIANPETAPYGMAAREVLNKVGLWKDIQHKLIVGENISHTFQYVQSGNVPLAFVAASQLLNVDDNRGCRWDIQTDYYQPLAQQVVWLKSAENRMSAKAFMTFLQSATAKEVFQGYGYGLPL